MNDAWVSIIVALIGLAGAIISAWIMYKGKPSSNSRQGATTKKKITIIISGLLGLVIGVGIGIPVAPLIVSLFEPSDNNLLKNGNFERDISDGEWKWNENVEVSRVAGFKNLGLCISLRGVRSEEDWGILSQEISVEPSQVYRFFGRLKWENVKQFHIKMESNKIDWGRIPDEDWRSGTSNGWVRRESQFTAPPNATRAKFVVLFQVGDREGRPSSVFVDELVFAAIR